jgi:hypothetical protein
LQKTGWQPDASIQGPFFERRKKMKFILVFLPILVLVACVVTGICAAKINSEWLGILCLGLFFLTVGVFDRVTNILRQLLLESKKKDER